MIFKLDKGAHIPTRAHEWDAGLDIYSRESRVVPARGSSIFDTGVHVEIPRYHVGFLKSKSGLNIKHGIVSEGVIDAGYTGSIVVKLYNLSDVPYSVEKGDKISQLVIFPIVANSEIVVCDEISTTERGDKGFGSSGK